MPDKRCHIRKLTHYPIGPPIGTTIDAMVGGIYTNFSR